MRYSAEVRSHFERQLSQQIEKYQEYFDEITLKNRTGKGNTNMHNK